MKTVGQSRNQSAGNIVLVGTFRPANACWIRQRKYYNLPLPICGKLPFHDQVSRLVLIAEGFQAAAYDVCLHGIVTGDWLKREGYRVAPKGREHGQTYALYELHEKLNVKEVLTDKAAKVFVASSRCPCLRIDDEFFARPYPRTGGRSMPYVFDKLRPYFRKWGEAWTFNPVQMDFFLEVQRPAQPSGDQAGMSAIGSSGCMKCLDFFAGSGLVSVALSDFFQTVWANDISEKKAKVFNANNVPGVLKVESIENVKGRDLPLASLSWGSFPCQDLSLAGDMNGLYASRSGLFWQWLRVMDEMSQRPPVVVAENVLGLVSADNGSYYETVHAELTARGYQVGAVMLDAIHWVPQSRKRVFVIAVRNDIDVSDYVETGPIWCHPLPIRNVAARVKRWHWWRLPIPARSKLSLEDIIDFDAPCDSPSDTKAKLDLVPRSKIEVVKEASRNKRRVFTGYRRTRNHTQVLEVRTDGVAGCLRTPCGGSSRQVVLIGERGELKTRLLTVRETARLMGAPDTFVIPGSYNEGYMAMGDGVAVPVARFLAEFLLAPLAAKVPMRG